MKVVVALLTCLLSLTAIGQSRSVADTAFVNATNKWFNAWTLVCKDIYRISTIRPVDFVFFDDKYVYSTSPLTVKKGTTIKGPKLMNLTFAWRKALHHDSLTLPDSSIVPIGLMSFAAETKQLNGRPFFVMPLPSFWAKAGVSSKELGLDNLITGVFIHEFSHSQQMQNFGKAMTLFEKNNDFGLPFSDDIVQLLFEKDSSYLFNYNQEADVLYKSVETTNLDEQIATQGLQLLKDRQAAYFINQYQPLDEIDDFFLTMEGLGQYSMYLWLTHPRGAGIEKTIAIEGVRRKKKWWSQDEGLVLFLILEKLSPPSVWAAEMFGNATTTVYELISLKLPNARPQ